MSDRRGLAVRLAALTLLGKRVSAEERRVKTALAAELMPGERAIAALDSGLEVASITYTRGRQSARVTDPNALADWVADNYPDEVQPQVRPAFLSAILDASKRAGVPMCPDGTLDVPGVAVGVGEPYLSTKVDEDKAAELAAAIRANGLLALEGGESDA